MPIISYQTEPFGDNAADLARKIQYNNDLLDTYAEMKQNLGEANVTWNPYMEIERPKYYRPDYGFNFKRNRIAFLSVVDANGTPIPIMGSEPATNTINTDSDIAQFGEPVYDRYYTDFILTSVQEQRGDKIQIIDTFGEAYYFTYGQSPKQLSISGFLFNTEDYNWRTRFWYNYENYLRGSKLAEMHARAYLSFDDVVIEGLIMNATSSLSGDSPNICPLTFTMIVTHYVQVSSAQPKEGLPEGSPFTGSVFMLNLPAAQSLAAYARVNLETSTYTTIGTRVFGSSAYGQPWWRSFGDEPSASDLFLQGMWEYLSDPTRAANLIKSGYDTVTGRGGIRPVALLTEVVGAGFDNMLGSKTLEGRLLDMIPQLGQNKMVQQFGVKLANEITQHAELTGEVLDDAITGGDSITYREKIGKNLFTMDIF